MEDMNTFREKMLAKIQSQSRGKSDFETRQKLMEMAEKYNSKQKPTETSNPNDNSGGFDKFMSNGGYALLPLITGGLGALLSKRGQKNRGFALGFQAGAQPAINIPGAIQDKYQKDALQRANRMMTDWAATGADTDLGMDTIQYKLQKEMGKTKFDMVNLAQLQNDIVNQRMKYFEYSTEEIRTEKEKLALKHKGFQNGSTHKLIDQRTGAEHILTDGTVSFEKMKKAIGATQVNTRLDSEKGHMVFTNLNEDQLIKAQQYIDANSNIGINLGEYIDGGMSMYQQELLGLEKEKLEVKKADIDAKKSIASMRSNNAWFNYQDSVNAMAIATLKGYESENIAEYGKAMELAKKYYMGDITTKKFDEDISKLKVDKTNKDKTKQIAQQINLIKTMQQGYQDQALIDKEYEKLQKMIEGGEETGTGTGKKQGY